MRGRSAGRVAVVAAALAVGLGVWRIGSVEAQAPGSAGARATSVAVVDIGRVLGLLEERSDRLQELEDFGRRLEEDVQAVEEQFASATSDLEVLPRGTPQWDDKQTEAIRLEMRLQGEKEFAKFRMNERKQRMKLELFNKIVSAAGIYAQREGYDVVLNDDRDMTIQEAQVGQMTDAAFEAFVQSRRVIFASEGVDITEEVAQLMNNQFKAQVGAE